MRTFNHIVTIALRAAFIIRNFTLKARFESVR